MNCNTAGRVDRAHPSGVVINTGGLDRRGGHRDGKVHSVETLGLLLIAWVEKGGEMSPLLAIQACQGSGMGRL